MRIEHVALYVNDLEKPLARTGFAHLAFSVGSPEAVDRLTAQLAADGHRVASGPRTTGDGYYESCIVRLRATRSRSPCNRLPRPCLGIA